MGNRASGILWQIQRFNGGSQWASNKLAGLLAGTVLFLTSILLATACDAGTDVDWNAKLEDWTRNSEIVLLGRLVEVQPQIQPLAEKSFAAVGKIKVQRYLKGRSEASSIEVEFHTSSPFRRGPESEDVVYFIDKRLENGRYLMRPWRWSGSMWRSAEEAVFRTDKRMRIENMPRPEKPDKEISLSVAADDGQGKALTSIHISSYSDLELLAQLENHDNRSNTVMPPLDGSFVHWRYPYYDLEILDVNGVAVPPRPVARCGNVNAWKKRDFVSLAAGEVFRFRIPTNPYSYELAKGQYRLRVKYTAKRSLRLKGLSGDNEKGVGRLMRRVWRGVVHSNWIEITIADREQQD
jgi:hypothetical protein